jgi:hypothetical protein
MPYSIATCSCKRVRNPITSGYCPFRHSCPFCYSYSFSSLFLFIICGFHPLIESRFHSLSHDIIMPFPASVDIIMPSPAFADMFLIRVHVRVEHYAHSSHFFHKFDVPSGEFSCSVRDKPFRYPISSVKSTKKDFSLLSRSQWHRPLW